MVEAIASDVVSRILGYLTQSVFEEVTSCWGGRSELAELRATMKMIQARILDAERLREGEDGALVKAWLIRLKDVLYQVDDLFEELSIVDQEKEQIPGNKLTKKVRLLFSKSSTRAAVKLNRRVNRDIKAIRKTMASITSDMVSLNFMSYPSNGDHRVVHGVNDRETHSFVMVEEVIGRDDEKNAIIHMLMADEEGQGQGSCVVSVIPIVGIGGLGKTTLAQLAYNDDCVEKHFELRSWACISDISNIKELGGKILKSITGEHYYELSLEQLQSRLREALHDKKYLLVLDDVWDEDRDRWLHLRQMLCGGKRGSKIIVTTRSRVVARNMGTVETYELSGLSEDKSWELFRRLAFRQGQEEENPSLTSIGKEIVKKCANVPLAIRTIAGLLYTKDTEQEWLAFEDCELGTIEQNENSIMSTLKLSYDHLPPRLKHCFAYCSLFPKDTEFDKQYLIHLWMAQGFIEPPQSSNQTVDEIGEGCFMDLLRRCFFQDVIKDDYGDITCCKMHDLMHDLALFVAGEECMSLDRPNKKLNDTVRHLRLSVRSLATPSSSSLAATQIRSLLLRQSYASYTELFSSFRGLRALDLHALGIETIPDSLGDLQHLRYLRLSDNLMKHLPQSLTTLLKLQTLILKKCYRLVELPRGLTKLVNLKTLDISECHGLNRLPSGFEHLTSLQVLSDFLTGETNGLDALANFNLGGKLRILVRERRRNAVSEAKTANLKEKRLSHLELRWFYHVAVSTEEDELCYLQPPPTLKSLRIESYGGVRLPQWGKNVFPNLVSIYISFCKRCQHLLPFSQFPHLRFLSLQNLEKLEYIELVEDNSLAARVVYFPSLEKLSLCAIRNVKAYWSASSHRAQSVFPRLWYLEIRDCPEMLSMNTMSLPRLEKLDLEGVHKKLVHELIITASVSSTSHSANSPAALPALKTVKIYNVDSLITLPMEASRSFSALEIKECPEISNLPVGSLSSLRHLYIRSCEKLTRISNALQHASVLEKLVIQDCNELDLWDEEKSLVACRGLKSLRLLGICEIPRLQSLPEGLRCLTALQELYICCCDNLMGLPVWISDLPQLRYLEIKGRSSPLIGRCWSPDGEDWPLIQHIPQVVIEEAGTLLWYNTLAC